MKSRKIYKGNNNVYAKMGFLTYLKDRAISVGLYIIGLLFALLAILFLGRNSFFLGIFFGILTAVCFLGTRYFGNTKNH